MVIEEANVEKLAVWCCAHIAADGFAPKSQICDLTCWTDKCLRELDIPMLPYYFHTYSPWACEVTKSLKARCGSVSKKKKKKKSMKAEKELWLAGRLKVSIYQGVLKLSIPYLNTHWYILNWRKKKSMGQNQALFDIKLSELYVKTTFSLIQWFLTGEMPVFVLHIS